ncbi:MAG: hypothetical protein J6T94_09780 [Bacteroidaceae bacterium]|nr:hypothetical protein [Bacteroidaceae bacterium]
MNKTKPILSLLALLCGLTVAAQNSVTKCEYWLDQQFDSRQMATLSSDTWGTEIDISALDDGLHSVALRVFDSNKTVSAVTTKFFVKLAEFKTITTSLTDYDYWLDRDYDHRVSGALSKSGTAVLDLDIDALEPGLHSIALRVHDSADEMSAVTTKYFVKLEETKIVDASLTDYDYWLDRDYDKRQSGALSKGGTAILDLDLTALEPGLHNIALRVHDSADGISAVIVKYFVFLDKALAADNSLGSFEYWIDDGFDSRQSADFASDGVVDLQMDIDTLCVGLHQLSFRAFDTEGQVSAVGKKLFLVVKEEDNRLIAYDYWINNGNRTRVGVEPQMSLDFTDVEIPLDGVKPNRIQPDYTFDVATMKVLTRDTITVGFQVFNGEGVGSTALLNTVEDVMIAVDPNMQAISNEQSNALPALSEGEMQGYRFDTAPGDSLYWIIDDGDLCFDFYNGEGAPLVPDTVTVADVRMLAMKAPTEQVYVLAYGVCEAGKEMLVSKPIVVSALSYEREYGDENPDFGFSTQGAEVIGSPEIVCEATATSPVGTYPIVIRKGDVANHNDSYVNGTLTITKAMLTVSVDNAVREENEENPEFVIRYEGFKNGEDSSVLIKKPVATTEADVHSAPGDYDIIVGGAEAENYDFTYVGGTLTIQVNSKVHSIITTEPVNVYTLSGMKIRSQVTALDDLPNGTYIVNGRKVQIMRRR